MTTERKPARIAPSTPRSAEIIDFRAARRRELQRRKAKEGYVAETSEQARRRTIQNLAAAAVVSGLVVGGLWLIVHLRQSLKIEECVESGRRNCVTIDTAPSQQN